MKGGRRIESSRNSSIRAPKASTQLAFCVAYVGSSFRGLQLQGHAPMHHTVEGAFIHALRDAGVILKVEGGRIADANHFLGRSCRTDRGVHAIRNLITIFIPNERFLSTFEASTQRICDAVNQRLPPVIRVLAVTKVMPTFSAKNCCNRRVYHYFIPAYALMDGKSDTWQNWLSAYPDAVACLNGSDVHHGSSRILSPGSSEERADAATSTPPAANSSWIETLASRVHWLNKEAVSHFVGSHRFHNYTADTTDQSGRMSSKSLSSLSDEAVRVISRCEIAPQVVFLDSSKRGSSNAWLHEMLLKLKSEHAPELSEVEIAHVDSVLKSMDRSNAETSLPKLLPFVVFQVEGASFLLNMIRKMVGTIIAVARGARPGLVKDTLSARTRASNPMAPGPYLSLSLSSYQGYDTVARMMINKNKKVQDNVESSLAPKSSPAADESLTSDARTASEVATDADVDRKRRQKAIMNTYLALEDSWNTEFHVQTTAADFYWNTLATEMVDADANRIPPLDTSLFLRDASRRHDPLLSVSDSTEDRHLHGMKEFAPSKPVAVPPTASEITVFLRLLRVHNWNLRPVAIPENSKVANELARQSSREEAESHAKHQGESIVGDAQLNQKRSREQSSLDEVDVGDDVEYPPNYDDGWTYVAPTPEKEAEARACVIRQRYLNTRRMKREFGARKNQQQQLQQGAAVAAQGSNDFDDAGDDAEAVLMVASINSECGDGD